MRLVLGVSLTASSAAWALVDTDDGRTVSEEVAALDSVNESVHEIASATARNLQDFHLKAQHDIEGVRLTWSDDAREHGIRLRTKLRLFGFETVETVSQDAAREGLNKTARYFAPHVDMAYGAARSDVHADESGSALRQLAARVRTGAARVPTGAARVRIGVAVATGAAVVLGVGLFAIVGLSPSEVPDTTAAVSTPSEPGAEVGPVPAATSSALPAPSAVAKPVAVPAETPAAPTPAPKPVTVWRPATTWVQPEAVTVPDSVSVPNDIIEVELDSTAPETIPALVGQPHLPVAHLPAAPAHLPVGPAQLPVGPAQAVAVVPQFVPPAPTLPVLSSLFSALP